jgi:hypothetical protein
MSVGADEARTFGWTSAGASAVYDNPVQRPKRICFCGNRRTR